MIEKLYARKTGTNAFEYTNRNGKVVGSSYKDSSGRLHYFDESGNEIRDIRHTDPSSGKTETFDYASGRLKSTSYRDQANVSTSYDPAGRKTGTIYIDDQDNIYRSIVSDPGRAPTYKDVYDEAALRGIAYSDAKKKAYRSSRSERDFCRPSNSELVNYHPKKYCTADDAQAYIRYAAYLLYKNAVACDSYVREEFTAKDIVRRGPFGLLSKSQTRKIYIPKEKYWELKDSGTRYDNYSDNVLIFEEHTYIGLFPGGKIMERTTEEKVIKDTGNLYHETGLREISISSDPATYVALVNRLLSQKSISMSFDRFIDERRSITYDDSYVSSIRKQTEEERRQQTKASIKDERTFSNLHWIAAVIFVISLFTGTILPGWIPHIVMGTVFFLIWRKVIEVNYKMKPLASGIRFEIIVIALTSVTIFMKYKLNEWLYQNYYDNRLSLLLLSCIIPVMIASAISKLIHR